MIDKEIIFIVKNSFVEIALLLKNSMYVVIEIYDKRTIDNKIENLQKLNFLIFMNTLKSVLKYYTQFYFNKSFLGYCF